MIKLIEGQIPESIVAAIEILQNETTVTPDASVPMDAAPNGEVVQIERDGEDDGKENSTPPVRPTMSVL